MSNIQSQLDKVLSTVSKLTNSFKSFQRHQKKLSDTVDKIHNQFKKLNKTIEHLKPIVRYAQETARMRSDFKTYYQSIKQYLFARDSTPKIIQSEAVSQAGNIIYATQNVIQKNISNKKFELNLSFGGDDDSLDLKRIWDALKKIFKGIKTVLKGLGSVFMWLLRIVEEVLLTIGRLFLRIPILSVITAIAIAAIYIWKNWDTLKEKLLVLWKKIKNTFSNAWQGIKDLVDRAWEGIKGKIGNVWEQVKQKTFSVWDNIKSYLSQKWNAISQYISIVWEGIKAKLSNIWEPVKQYALDAWSNIQTYLSEKWEGIKQSVFQVWENIKNIISSAWGSVKLSATKYWVSIKSSLLEKWELLKKSVVEKWESLKGKFSKITDLFKFWKSDNEEITQKVKVVQEITSSNGTHIIQTANLPARDKGGPLSVGEWGIVGEYGPEIMNGPANVTSRKNTAKLAVLGFAVSSMSLPAVAQDAPLHAQSLPAHIYEAVQAKRERSQPQQYSGVVPQYNIYVYGSQGQSTQDIARMVRQELEQRERMQQARMRSSLSDRGEDFS
ncbi:PblA [Xenorhabdus vietnamensis]|uniref:PblA n=1 Tax=Xenorhabdus vietnamensis TaxID=351656 RepID=A0A1Y2SBG7_9GAMM|nr:hypothetical protein [Xenorhabdus vietnamensis]OTA14874.1 PblA [Xenorhabdus vietnamensis]